MRAGRVALVGTTASGKSTLAMEVARRRGDVEILCVDSMTVYRGMDIGTAKPSLADQAEVAHHLLDLADPSEEFTVRRFQRDACDAFVGIESRGGRSLLVGGTGLYMRAVVDDLEIPPRFPDVAARLELEASEPDGPSRLYERLTALDPDAAVRIEAGNRRRVLRALEVTEGSKRPFSSYGPGLSTYGPSDTVTIGLPFDPDTVDRRIGERFSWWMSNGLLTEVRALVSHAGAAGLSSTARQAIGYKELLSHLADGAPLDACVEEAVRRTRKFARRQWSWFRRDPRIRWVEDGEDPGEVLEAALDGVREGPSRGAGSLGAPEGCANRHDGVRDCP